MNHALILIQKIKHKTAHVGIIGMGYVGSHVAFETIKKGFITIGFEIDSQKIDYFNRLRKKNLRVTSDFQLLDTCDIVCICVPTLLQKNNTPDLSRLNEALKTIAQHLKRGQLIILESSVAPQTTRKFVVTILEKSRLKAGSDFFLAYSPERVDPGNKKCVFSSIPKIVAGIDPTSTGLASQFYSNLVDHIVTVSSLETAELAKVIENVFRLVNISLVNEMATYAQKLGIDIWEVINAAATKPFGFMAHYPSTGAGGYCIPVLSQYLLASSKKHKISLPLLKQAIRTNNVQPRKVAERAFAILKRTGKQISQPKILLVGITYKKDIADIRESTALKVWSELDKAGATVFYHDPYVPQMNGRTSLKLRIEEIEKNHLIIITMNHTSINYQLLSRTHLPILDIKNVLNRKPTSLIYHL